MSYDKASPNAKIGCSNSNDPEFLEQLVREGKTNREIALILDLDYGSVAQILSRYGIKRDPNRPCKRCGGPIGSTNTRQLYCKECQNAVDEVAQAEITEEEQERREQAAYYKGWQDGKQYYLENFGG
jgi:hypothetical protein